MHLLSLFQYLCAYTRTRRSNSSGVKKLSNIIDDKVQLSITDIPCIHIKTIQGNSRKYDEMQAWNEDIKLLQYG